MSASCTVIIPLHDGRAWIGRAIDSVLAQTRPDFELVIVDDGSNDGGGDLAAARRDPRLRVARQTRLGPGEARNRGLSQARTDWAAFLDCDDEWRPRFLEKTLAVAEGHPGLAAVFTDVLGLQEGRPWLGLTGEARVLENYLDFASRRGGRGMTCSSTLVSVAALRAAGGFPGHVARSEDHDAWLRLALTADIACVPEVLAVYHNDGYGSRRALPEPCYPEGVRTLRRLRAQDRIPERFRRPLRRLEAWYLITYARQLIEVGRPRAARRVLLRDCPWRGCPPAALVKALARAVGGRPG